MSRSPSGSKARAWCPAMRLSRPNRATNHGMPAAIRRRPASNPSGIASAARSAALRRHARPSAGGSDRTRTGRSVARAASLRRRSGPPPPPEARTAMSSVQAPPPARPTLQRARPASSASGAGSNLTSVARCPEGSPKRRTPASPVSGDRSAASTGPPRRMPRTWKMSAKSQPTSTVTSTRARSAPHRRSTTRSSMPSGMTSRRRSTSSGASGPIPATSAYEWNRADAADPIPVTRWVGDSPSTRTSRWLRWRWSRTIRPRGPGPMSPRASDRAKLKPSTSVTCSGAATARAGGAGRPPPVLTACRGPRRAGTATAP